MITSNQRLYLFLSIAGLLLLLPLIAMQFTSEVNWQPGDFAVMGGMLLGLSLGIEWALRKVKRTRSRLILGVSLVVLFLLAWAELAVGIFGTPMAGT